MSIERLKRWHWLLIGALLGVTVGYAQTAVGFDPLRAEPRALTQGQFEDELRQKTQGRPVLKDLRVYADGRFFLVKFLRLELQNDGVTYKYVDWQITPPVPYRPQRQAPHDRGPDYTVLNYLADAAGKDPAIRYRYAWWATKAMTLALWTAGGVVAIGVVWPTLLRLLVGAGFGRPADEPEYDLSRFRSEKDLEPAPADTSDDDDRLRALEEELERSLEAAAGPARVAADPTGAAPAKALSAGPLEAAGLAPAEDEKDYAGEFYPVAHGTKSKPANPKGNG